MEQRNRRAAWLAAIMVMVPATTQAEIILGGGIGIGDSEGYDDVKAGTAYRGFAGYRAADYPLLVEAQYFDSGDMDIKNTDLTLTMDGFAVSAGYRQPVGEGSGSDVFGKVGFYMEDSKLSASGGGSISDDASGVLLGVGGNWMFSPSFGLNLDLQFLLGAEDFGDDKSLTLATIGFVFGFYQE